MGLRARLVCGSIASGLRGGDFPRMETRELSVLPARAALGASMLYHGVSKLKPDGIGQTAGFFEKVGLKPGRFWTIATGLAEALAGVLTLSGVGTRVGALATLVTQAVAVRKVHLTKGYDVSKGGFEYNLALMAIAAGLLIAGPGLISANRAAERMLAAKGLQRFYRMARRRRALRALAWVG
jgi:putative oxidoreductase